MNIGFQGIGEVAATFKLQDGTELNCGNAVAMTGNGEVGMGNEGDLICGTILHMDKDGYACVQIGGLTVVGYNGTAPAAGWQKMCVDGDGKVKVAGADGMDYLVVSVDESAKTAVIKL